MKKIYYTNNKFLLLFFLTILSGFSMAQTIAAGGSNSFFICDFGYVMATGDNYVGQLGNETNDNTNIPVEVTNIFDIKAVAASGSHSLFLRSDGTVWATGDNQYGQLGNGNLYDYQWEQEYQHTNTPVQVDNVTDIVAIAAGGSHSLFLKSDGTVWATGWNNNGQFGDGSDTYTYTPFQIPNLSDIVAIAAGADHSLFLRANGTVLATGRNNSGQLGNGTNDPTNIPVQVPNLVDIVAIEAALFHSLFLKGDGSVWGTGSNFIGELGDGTNDDTNTPVQVSNVSDVVAISATAKRNSFFLKSDGTVWATGENWNGQLGNGTNTVTNTPIQIPNLFDVVAITNGLYCSFFLKSNGTVWATGWNHNGQLGNGTNDDTNIPVQVYTSCNVKQPENNLKGVRGYVYLDINENCEKDVGEVGLNKRNLILSPGNIVLQTNVSGFWHIDSLPPGEYTLTADTSGNWMGTCPNPQTFTVTDSDELTLASNFGFVSTEPCPEPTVSLNMPFMRLGFSNQRIYINACNQNSAPEILEDTYVDVSLDELITVDSASMSYTNLGDNTFRFDVGTLNPGQCTNFNLFTTLSVDAQLSSTLCMEANLLPKDSCTFYDPTDNPDFPDGVTPCEEPWDKSSINVEGWCENDTVYFTITNTGEQGEGDMECYSPVRVYIDGEMFYFDSIQLQGGEMFTYTFEGTGQTYRLEADQHPLYPDYSQPNATVELCGDAENWTPDLVNILPHDDEDSGKDIFCGIVTGSYDPNDKQGFPTGITEERYIMPNQDIEYLIRFQNTGTDTAFTVVIRDTLSTDLDIFSVVSGVSSHDYEFTMHGPRVLEWTFNDILLPDSTTNEPESNGFVTFTVKQVPDLPNGTTINNDVGIYFDFNEPIITNTTLHTINSCIQSPRASASFVDDSALLALPQINVADNVYVWEDCNTGEVLANTAYFEPEESGQYAVTVTTPIGCISTSSCIDFSLLKTEDYLVSNNFTIYPVPVPNNLKIISKNELQSAKMRLTDLNGRVVYSKNNLSGTDFEIDMNKETKGVYILEITDQTTVVRKKVVKQ